MSLARATLAGQEVEFEVAEASILGDPVRGPAEVGMEQGASGVDDPLQHDLLHSVRVRAGSIGIARSNRLASGIDEQWVGKARVGKRTSKGIDRWRANIRAGGFFRHDFSLGA